jgi:hypothetical protein
MWQEEKERLEMAHGGILYLAPERKIKYRLANRCAFLNYRRTWQEEAERLEIAHGGILYCTRYQREI